MSYRRFADQAGKTWEVWAVNPSKKPRLSTIDGLLEAERRHARTVAGSGPDLGEGWLWFQSGRKRRRLPCYPENWQTLSDEALRGLCATATEFGS